MVLGNGMFATWVILAALAIPLGTAVLGLAVRECVLGRWLSGDFGVFFWSGSITVSVGLMAAISAYYTSA